VAAAASPALAALVAEWRAVSAELDAVTEENWHDPKWEPLSKKCVALRSRIADTPARSQEAFKLTLVG